MNKNARPFRPSRSSRRHVVALFLFFLSPAIGQAAEERPGAHETVIGGDYFGAGASASPGGRVEGDALIAGGQVDLNQPVNGDALLAGGGVAISDRVAGNLYATGGGVIIDAPVAGNARIAGGYVEITKRGQVSGRTTLVGGRVMVLGKAGRQLVVFGEHVTLDGEVAGNVTIASRTLSLGPNARVPIAGWFIGMLLLVMGIGAMALNAMGATVPVRIKKEKRRASLDETESGARREPTLGMD